MDRGQAVPRLTARTRASAWGASEPGLSSTWSTRTRAWAEASAGPVRTRLWSAAASLPVRSRATAASPSTRWVTSAPALWLIDELEPEPRGPYCGAIGWVEGGRARLAVGIRTFWWEHGTLRFGTGAGITWGSDPAGEWDETELKARRLVALASEGS